ERSVVGALARAGVHRGGALSGRRRGAHHGDGAQERERCSRRRATQRPRGGTAPNVLVEWLTGASWVTLPELGGACTGDLLDFWGKLSRHGQREGDRHRPGHDELVCCDRRGWHPFGHPEPRWVQDDAIDGGNCRERQASCRSYRKASSDHECREHG